MKLTLVNLAKKGNLFLVSVKSTVSGHQMLMLRTKPSEKYEFVRYDPLVNQEVLYKEEKKIKTIDKSRGSKE